MRWCWLYSSQDGFKAISSACCLFPCSCIHQCCYPGLQLLFQFRLVILVQYQLISQEQAERFQAELRIRRKIGRFSMMPSGCHLLDLRGIIGIHVYRCIYNMIHIYIYIFIKKKQVQHTRQFAYKSCCSRWEMWQKLHLYTHGKNIGSPWLLWDILSPATHALIVHWIHAQQRHPPDPVHIVDTNVGI